MTAIHAWLADANGYLAGELDSPNSADDWDTFAANAAKNGQTAIAKGDDPAATRPPDRPTANVATIVYPNTGTTDQKVDAIAKKLGLL